jgi:hypothetical protein
MLTLDPHTIFPIIKSHDWGKQALQRNGVVEPVFMENEEPAEGPYVTYGFDQGESIGYLQTDTLAPEVPMQEVKNQAYANLRRELAQQDWHELDYSQVLPGLKALGLTDHFFAAEALLLEERMQEAHSKLGAKTLLACTPVRGMLIVVPFDNDDPKVVEVFLSVCYENYHSGEQEPISPIVWAVHNGQIKGFLNVNQEFQQFHAAQYQAPAGQTQSTEEEQPGKKSLFTRLFRSG